MNKRYCVSMATVALLLTSGLSGCVSLPDKARAALTLTQEAELAYQQGNCEQAIVLYRQLAKALPNDTHSLLRVGNCHARSQQDDLAVDAYREAIARDPSFVKAWYNLSYLQTKMLGKTVAQMSANTDPTDPTLEQVRRLSKKILDAFEAEKP